MRKETDRQKFVRLATARVNKAIRVIQLIGNLSNRSNYSYEDTDVEKIFRALNNEVKVCRQRFENRADSSAGFKLD